MQAAAANFNPAQGARLHRPTGAAWETEPDFVILCPATGLARRLRERVAPYGVHILVEKPFAASLREADRMISAVRRTGRLLAINWPLRWYPCHVTAHRLLCEGRIGALQEVHFYDGNRGPLSAPGRQGPSHADRGDEARSWFYRRDSAADRSWTTWATARPWAPGTTAGRSRPR